MDNGDVSGGVRGVRRPTRMGSQQPRAEPNSQSLCGKHDTSPTGRTRSTLNDATPRQPEPHEDLLHTRRPPNTNQRHYTCTQLYSADCPVRKAPRARLRTAPPPQSHTASVSHRLSLAPPQSHTPHTPHTPHPAGIPHPHSTHTLAKTHAICPRVGRTLTYRRAVMISSRYCTL